MCPDGITEIEPQNAKTGKRKGYHPIIVLILESEPVFQTFSDKDPLPIAPGGTHLE